MKLPTKKPEQSRSMAPAMRNPVLQDKNFVHSQATLQTQKPMPTSEYMTLGNARGQAALAQGSIGQAIGKAGLQIGAAIQEVDKVQQTATYAARKAKTLDWLAWYVADMDPTELSKQKEDGSYGFSGEQERFEKEFSRFMSKEDADNPLSGEYKSKWDSELVGWKGAHARKVDELVGLAEDNKAISDGFFALDKEITVEGAKGILNDVLKPLMTPASFTDLYQSTLVAVAGEETRQKIVSDSRYDRADFVHREIDRINQSIADDPTMLSTKMKTKRVSVLQDELTELNKEAHSSEILTAKFGPLLDRGSILNALDENSQDALDGGQNMPPEHYASIEAALKVRLQEEDAKIQMHEELGLQDANVDTIAEAMVRNDIRAEERAGESGAIEERDRRAGILVNHMVMAQIKQLRVAGSEVKMSGEWDAIEDEWKAQFADGGGPLGVHGNNTELMKRGLGQIDDMRRSQFKRAKSDYAKDAYSDGKFFGKGGVEARSHEKDMVEARVIRGEITYDMAIEQKAIIDKIGEAEAGNQEAKALISYSQMNVQEKLAEIERLEKSETELNVLVSEEMKKVLREQITNLNTEYARRADEIEDPSALASFLSTEAENFTKTELKAQYQALGEKIVFNAREDLIGDTGKISSDPAELRASQIRLSEDLDKMVGDKLTAGEIFDQKASHREWILKQSISNNAAKLGSMWEKSDRKFDLTDGVMEAHVKWIRFDATFAELGLEDGDKRGRTAQYDAAAEYARAEHQKWNAMFDKHTTQYQLHLDGQSLLHTGSAAGIGRYSKQWIATADQAYKEHLRNESERTKVGARVGEDYLDVNGIPKSQPVLLDEFVREFSHVPTEVYGPMARAINGHVPQGQDHGTTVGNIVSSASALSRWASILRNQKGVDTSIVDKAWALERRLVGVTNSRDQYEVITNHMKVVNTNISEKETLTKAFDRAKAEFQTLEANGAYSGRIADGITNEYKKFAATQPESNRWPSDLLVGNEGFANIHHMIMDDPVLKEAYLASGGDIAYATAIATRKILQNGAVHFRDKFWPGDGSMRDRWEGRKPYFVPNSPYAYNGLHGDGQGNQQNSKVLFESLVEMAMLSGMSRADVLAGDMREVWNLNIPGMPGEQNGGWYIFNGTNKLYNSETGAPLIFRPGMRSKTAEQLSVGLDKERSDALAISRDQERAAALREGVSKQGVESGDDPTAMTEGDASDMLAARGSTNAPTTAEQGDRYTQGLRQMRELVKRSQIYQDLIKTSQDPDGENRMQAQAAQDEANKMMRDSLQDRHNALTARGLVPFMPFNRTQEAQDYQDEFMNPTGEWKNNFFEQGAEADFGPSA